MRKYIYLVCLLFLFFALSINVYAIEYVNNVFMISLDGKENINTDSEIVLNINVDVRYDLNSILSEISYDKSKINLIKCESDYFTCTYTDKILLDSIEGIKGNKDVASLTFKVLEGFKPGEDVLIELKNVEGYSNTRGNNTKFKIHKLQNDTNLLSLIVKDETLDPTFTSDNTIYSLRTKKSSINIEATSNSKILNTGLKNLKIGNNVFEIIVNAENGEEKKYIINAFREEDKKSNNSSSTTNDNTAGTTKNNNGSNKNSNNKSNNNKKSNITSNNNDRKDNNATDNKTLSSNKKLKFLTINGIDFGFKEDIFEYSFEVDSDVKQVKVNYELDDSKSKVVISGDTIFSKKENVITISVISEDGSKLDYKINVTKKDDNLTSVEDSTKKSNDNVNENGGKTNNNNNSKIFIIISIIIALIAGIILLKKIFNKR